MKKILSILLMGILVVGLTGCGNSKETKSEDSYSNDETTQETSSTNHLESQFIGEWTGKSNTNGEVVWKFEKGGEATYSEYLDTLSEPKWSNVSANYEVIDEDTIHIQVHNAFDYVNEFNYEIKDNKLKMTYVKALDVPAEQQKWVGFKSFELSKKD